MRTHFHGKRTIKIKKVIVFFEQMNFEKVQKVSFFCRIVTSKAQCGAICRSTYEVVY